MPYQRVNFDEVEVRFLELIEELKAAKSGEEQFEVHKKYYKLVDHTSSLMVIGSIRHDGNTIDEFYEAEQNYYDEIMPKFEDFTTKYAKVLYDLPYRDYLEKKIGKVAFKNIELKLKAFNETLIPLMQEENILTTTYSKLIAGAKIEFEGEVLNMSLLRKYLTSDKREIRKVHGKNYLNFLLIME